MGIHDRSYYQDDDASILSPSWDQRSAISMIIIACSAVFLANMIFSSRDNSIFSALSLHTSDLNRPWMWWRTLSYGFVHSYDSISHILFNMLSLWMLGRAVESRYGKVEFLAIYLVSVLVCGMLWMISHGLAGSLMSLCGASGACSAITMLFVLNFPRMQVMFMFVIPMQAWVLGVIFIAINLLGSSAGVRAVGENSPIAYDVHLYGIVLACVYFFGKFHLSPLYAPLANWRLTRRKLFGPKLKSFRPNASQASDDAEADRILEKIHQHGQDSLTRKEKQFMAKYSQRIRMKKSND